MGKLTGLIEEAAARDPRTERRVRCWRAAGRATLATLLVYAGLQYYFFDVYLQIITLPRVALVALP